MKRNFKSAPSPFLAGVLPIVALVLFAFLTTIAAFGGYIDQPAKPQGSGAFSSVAAKPNPDDSFAMGINAGLEAEKVAFEASGHIHMGSFAVAPGLFAGTVSTFFESLCFNPLAVAGIIAAIILSLIIYRMARKKAPKPRSSQDGIEPSGALLKIALSNMSCMMFEIDYRTGMTASYKAACSGSASCSIADSFAENGDFSRLVHPFDQEPVARAKEGAANGERITEYELRLQTSADADDYSWFKVCITNIFSDDGKAFVGVGTLEDINTRKKREMSLSMMALHDSFTGLLNRTEGARLVSDYLSAPCSEGGTMIIFDMDNLKEINDAYGHPVGDRAITLMSQAMKSVFRSSDIMIRIGGDEFIVFLRNVVGDDFIAKRYSLMKCRLLDLYDGTPLPKGIISFSLGYANVYHGDTFESAYSKADVALYHAKNRGKGTHFAYADGIIRPEAGAHTQDHTQD